MELISDVGDGWVDPDRDAIGKELLPVLSELSLQSWAALDEAVPEQKENRQRVENLRAFQRALRRRTATHTQGLI